eukprot:CAMPEP_0179085538 /NCGR_PEP_ID=MMETSP0796-20121207/38745_1 /TAXON_ID=73915 /ORGANISM="Pyrodinium bahamense, Strain pbaha01" /LENGTH=200 /DNA_ID=CAMNT_0020782979 /DNA_START=52 /DNA_END=654 /DNA_ORIENTATION=+
MKLAIVLAFALFGAGHAAGAITATFPDAGPGALKETPWKRVEYSCDEADSSTDWYKCTAEVTASTNFEETELTLNQETVAGCNSVIPSIGPWTSTGSVTTNSDGHEELSLTSVKVCGTECKTYPDDGQDNPKLIKDKDYTDCATWWVHSNCSLKYHMTGGTTCTPLPPPTPAPTNSGGIGALTTQVSLAAILPVAAMLQM